MRDANRRVTPYVGKVSDITEARNVREQLEHQVSHEIGLSLSVDDFGLRNGLDPATMNGDCQWRWRRRGAIMAPSNPTRDDLHEVA